MLEAASQPVGERALKIAELSKTIPDVRMSYIRMRPSSPETARPLHLGRNATRGFAFTADTPLNSRIGCSSVCRASYSATSPAVMPEALVAKMFSVMDPRQVYARSGKKTEGVLACGDTSLLIVATFFMRAMSTTLKVSDGPFLSDLE